VRLVAVIWIKRITAFPLQHASITITNSPFQITTAGTLCTGSPHPPQPTSSYSDNRLPTSKLFDAARFIFGKLHRAIRHLRS